MAKKVGIIPGVIAVASAGLKGRDWLRIFSTWADNSDSGFSLKDTSAQPALSII